MLLFLFAMLLTSSLKCRGISEETIVIAFRISISLFRIQIRSHEIHFICSLWSE